MRRRRREPEPTPGDYASADALRASVTRRTGIPADRLVCPRARSDMTPCVARDGHLAVCLITPPAQEPRAACVGCERSIAWLVEDERRRGA